jgi:hypothetical protein
MADDGSQDDDKKTEVSRENLAVLSAGSSVQSPRSVSTTAEDGMVGVVCADARVTVRSKGAPEPREVPLYRVDRDD